jgi:hypothetical protein
MACSASFDPDSEASRAVRRAGVGRRSPRRSPAWKRSGRPTSDLARGLLAAPALEMSSNLVGLWNLVERVRRGEIAALAELYESEAPVLMALALRVTADRRVAEEVVHEVFCALWRNPGAVGREVRDYLVRSTLGFARAATPPPERKRLVSRVRRRAILLDLRSRQ